MCFAKIIIVVDTKMDTLWNTKRYKIMQRETKWKCCYSISCKDLCNTVQNLANLYECTRHKDIKWEFSYFITNKFVEYNKAVTRNVSEKVYLLALILNFFIIVVLNISVIKRGVETSNIIKYIPIRFYVFWLLILWKLLCKK